MKPNHLHLLLPAVVLLLAGCVTTPTTSPEPTEVDMLVANQHYGRALDLLARVDPGAENYQQMAEKRRHIEALAASYEQGVRSQTRNDVEQGNWRAAMDRYDDALTRLPQSMVLRDGLAQFLQQQTQEIERLETERLLAQGRWLKETIPTYQQIARVNPRSRTANQQLNRIQQQAVEVADKLALIGNRALANNELEHASQTLFLAQELSNTPVIAESVTKLQEQLNHRRSQEQQQRAQRQQQQQAAEQSRQQRIRQHHNRYIAARSDNDYRAAREQLAQLRRIDPDNQQWKKEHSSLEAAIEERNEQLFTRGINAYGRGQYEEAAIAWEEVLTLDPEHKLAQDNLERARRVLQRIEQLQQRQESGN